VSFEPLWGTGD